MREDEQPRELHRERGGAEERRQAADEAGGARGELRVEAREPAVDVGGSGDVAEVVLDEPRPGPLAEAQLVERWAPIRRSDRKEEEDERREAKAQRAAQRDKRCEEDLHVDEEAHLRPAERVQHRLLLRHHEQRHGEERGYERGAQECRDDEDDDDDAIGDVAAVDVEVVLVKRRHPPLHEDHGRERYA